MRRLSLLLLALASLVLAGQAPAPTRSNAPTLHAAPTVPVAGPDTPAAALAELAAGNQRFAMGKRVRTMDTGHDAAMRTALLKGQSPFAVIITCSDSRVPESLLFDQEAGRLFTIREAGNAADLQGLASAEYAVAHLGSKLILVMGHTGCGAVKAVYEANGRPLPGNLWALQAGMAGLLESTPEDPDEDGKAYVARLEEINARRQAQAILDRSELIRGLADAGKVQVVAALYHLDTGKVQFLKPAPMVGAAPPAHH